jgi:orotate phosphoribosyltransferase
MSTVISHYMHKVLDQKERYLALRSAKKTLKPLEIDVIAISGMSGIFGALLAEKMKSGLILVRKTDDNTHSCFSREGHVLDHHDRWIIVDDLIDSGETIRRIHRSLNCVRNFNAKNFLGIYLFNTEDFILSESDLMQAILSGAHAREWEESQNGQS